MNKISTKSFELAVYARGNETAQKFALVLPGQLDTKDYPHMRGHVDFLANRGYYALSFDPPGTWESPGDIKIYTMTNYLKAINELIEHFGSRPTFTIGHSRGGAMSLLAGTTNPVIESFACVMSFYTYDPTINTNYDSRHVVGSWRDKGFRESTRDLPENPDKKRTFKLPYSFVEDQRKYDMLEDLKKCKKPKLFMALKTSWLSRKSSKLKIEAAPEPKEIYELNSDHDYRRNPEMIEEVNQVVSKFLNGTNA